MSPGRKTWQESYDYAIAQGGMIPSLKVAQDFVALKGQLIIGNFWVAVGDSSSKDWMEIGTDPGSGFL